MVRRMIEGEIAAFFKIPNRIPFYKPSGQSVHFRKKEKKGMREEKGSDSGNKVQESDICSP